MALSKPTFLSHLRRTLSTKLHNRNPVLQVFSSSVRHLSFATPEDAAADRRRRKRRLRIEPPLGSSNFRQQQQQQPRAPAQNPNAPMIPDSVSLLVGNRLNLHNRILKLVRENDLDEAALLTRHSVYSNCRPTVFTCNAVMAAQLRQSRYSELLSLHRFITQAGIAPNIVTHNLLINAFMDCRKTDTALEHYKQLINDAPFNPSPTTYRILIKGLVDNNKVEKAMELREDMLSKGFDADPLIYHYLMMGQVKNSNPDGVFELFDELKEKMGGSVEDGVVFGNLMKGYFLKGMEIEAMQCFQEAVGENSKIKMSAIAYNSVLDALGKNGKFDEALILFDKIMAEHSPPKKLTVNLGTFNVMVDGYCAENRFKDAIEVFNNMGEKRCRPDTLSYSNLMEHLCKNDMLGEAEELYKGMSEKEVNPDESIFALLMDTCFEQNRTDDAATYFKTMVDLKLRPNLAVYNRLIDGLVKVEKINEAKSFYELMVGKLKMDDPSYEKMMKALFDVGKADEVLGMVGNLLRDEGLEFSEELKEFVNGGLSKEGREGDLTKLIEDVEMEKAEVKRKEEEAAEKAKASARDAINTLLPSKLFGKKESEEKTDGESEKAEEGVIVNEELKEDSVGDEKEIRSENVVKEGVIVSESKEDGVRAEEEIRSENVGEEEVESGLPSEQITTA